MKIGLLLCDHVAERFQHISGDYPEMFTAWLTRCAPEFQLEFFDVCNGEFPAATAACDAFMTTGSRFSAYDDVNWIHRLKIFVRQMAEANTPFVGICFGHQILAEALGGKVIKASQGWGVGVREIELVQTEPWMSPAQSNFHLHYMHQDQVQQLPENSVVLGRSEHAPVAMFRTGESMLGIQAHPEFTNKYCEALLHDRVHKIGEDRVESALQSLRQNSSEELIARWIVEWLRT